MLSHSTMATRASAFTKEDMRSPGAAVSLPAAAKRAPSTIAEVSGRTLSRGPSGHSTIQ